VASFLRVAALLRLLASLVLRHLPPKLLLPLPLPLRPPLRLVASAALLVGLGLPKLLEPVRRPLGPLLRTLARLLPELPQLLVLLTQARLLPVRPLWTSCPSCSPIVAALFRALIVLMAGHWIWTPCSIRLLQIKRSPLRISRRLTSAASLLLMWLPHPRLKNLPVWFLLRALKRLLHLLRLRLRRVVSCRQPLPRRPLTLPPLRKQPCRSSFSARAVAIRKQPLPPLRRRVLGNSPMTRPEQIWPVTPSPAFRLTQAFRILLQRCPQMFNSR
jgi:hypothetical protein